MGIGNGKGSIVDMVVESFAVPHDKANAFWWYVNTPEEVLQGLGMIGDGLPQKGWIMNFRSGTTRLLAAAASAAAAIGCAGTYDLEPDLQASVGVYVGELNAASWARRTLISDDGTTRTMQYGFDEGCRFVLEMDSRSYVVKSWRYADAESARSCRKLRMQRAV
jgi:hypothetical protein